MLHNSNKVPIFAPESNKYDALKHQNTMKKILKLASAVIGTMLTPATIGILSVSDAPINSATIMLCILGVFVLPTILLMYASK